MTPEVRMDAATRAALGMDGSERIRPLGQGQFNVAILVEPDLVVRFPRHGLGVESLRVERSIVRSLHAKVDVALTGDVQRLLGGRMTTSQRSRARNEIAGLAAVERGHAALVHTDLGGNLLWDAENRHLGAIDWGGACVSDPVLDLASLAALDGGLATDVGARVNHLRGRAADVEMVRATFHLQDALNEARQEHWSSVDALLVGY